MSTRANPYQSPPETESQVRVDGQAGGFGKICFWAGLAFTSFGFVAMFLPNLPPIGFLLIALSFFVVTLIGDRGYRKRAIAGITVCLVLSGGFLFQMRLMHAKLAAERARQQAMTAEQAARVNAESSRSDKSDSNAAQ
ncbi:MAG: hypothetical protein F9B45_16385 [Phycisphaera sp. RhM]|nr:hypothetical protein [Phycisphaera sp. RhM]